MTRKDYVKAASILNAAAYRVEMDLPTVTHLAVEFAAMFEEDNERFDRALFLKACFAPKEA